MGKRVIALFCSFVLMFLLLTVWLMRVTFGDDYVQAAASRGSYTLTVKSTRGRIYDRNMNAIAGGVTGYRAVIEPSAYTAYRLVESYDSTVVAGLEEKLRSYRPFVIDVPDGSLNGDGITVYRVFDRYGSKSAIAPHVVGYLNGEGQGAYGIEYAYNDLLEEYSGALRVKYVVDAMGGRIETEAPAVTDTTYRSYGGVVLTLDSEVQLIAQQAASMLDSGAVVIMDPYTGQILGCASSPTFLQDNIAASLNGENSPLVNKAFAAYDVGSVFKLTVAAAAVENGMEDFACDCKGYVLIGDKRFSCVSEQGHGFTDLTRAIASSCNCYFILLAKELGAQAIFDAALGMGFGNKTALGDNYFSSAGHLPDDSELSLPAGLANFSFGQGSLLATPVQISGMISCIANGGRYIEPSLVLKTVDMYGDTVSDWKSAEKQLLSAHTAAVLTECMKETMISGTGRNLNCSVPVAAKSGTAETGMIENGKRVVQAWFAGFYPADEPKYVCVVLAENGVSGAGTAGPVFVYTAQRLMEIGWQVA